MATQMIIRMDPELKGKIARAEGKNTSEMVRGLIEDYVKEHDISSYVDDLWRKGDILLCLFRDILDEYFEVLRRIGFKDEEELGELIALFSKGFNIAFTAKTPKVEVVDDDPDNNKFLECTVALKAEVIITGDKALRALKEYMGLKILSPTKFFKNF